MTNEMLSTRIDYDTKVAFTNICDEVGLSTSQAIKLFAKAVINHGSIPFDLRVPQPNNVTVTVIQELIEGKVHKAESVEAMLPELTEGKVNNVWVRILNLIEERLQKSKQGVDYSSPNFRQTNIV